MTITLRNVKGAPLTNAELDANFSDLSNLKAPLADPTFTGDPKAPTPAQFDNDTSLATTAFVKRALGNRQGYVPASGTTALTAAQVGSIVIGTGTLNLPPLASVPAGGAYEIAATGAMTVACSGVERLQFNGNGAHLLGSLALSDGDTLTIVSTGSTWFAVDGSAALFRRPQFGASLASPGYTKLPSGAFIQWGTGAATQAGWGNSFPFTFPTTPTSLVAMHIGGDYTVNVIVGNLTASAFTLLTNYPAQVVAIWVATGY